MSALAPFCCRPDRRNSTGRVGVSLRRGWKTFAGQRVRRRWYVARIGNRQVPFSVETLGEAQAWREAVRLRERYERAIEVKRQVAALVVRARKLERTRQWKAKQAVPLNDPAYQAAWYQRNKERTRSYRRQNAERDNALRRHRRAAERGAAK